MLSEFIVVECFFKSSTICKGADISTDIYNIVAHKLETVIPKPISAVCSRIPNRCYDVNISAAGYSLQEVVQIAEKKARPILVDISFPVICCQLLDNTGT